MNNFEHCLSCGHIYCICEQLDNEIIRINNCGNLDCNCNNYPIEQKSNHGHINCTFEEEYYQARMNCTTEEEFCQNYKD